MSPPTSRRNSNTSDFPATSPLARTPKLPPPTSRTFSPARQPLHDRPSNFSGPTIRVVNDDPGTDIYSKNPFPSQAAHILPARTQPGYAFEHRGRPVSKDGTVANVVAKFEASHTPAPKPIQHRKAIRHSTSTSTSDADTLVASSISPSSNRFSQNTTPPGSPYPAPLVIDKGLEVLEEVPSPQDTTVRAVTASSDEGSYEGHALTPRASAVSLGSTASADTTTPTEPTHERTSSNITVTQGSKGKPHQHTSSSSSDKKKKKQASYSNLIRPTSQASSLAFSDITSVSEEPTFYSEIPSTIHEARTATLASGVRVLYPAVRAPSASSLWAESQDLPTITSRMSPGPVHHWSSQLSTIPSESEHSRSIERVSQSFSVQSQPRDDHASGRTNIPGTREEDPIGTGSSDENSNSNSSVSLVPVPRPLFSPVPSPTQHEDREFDELHDTISPLQSPPLRTKRSAFLRAFDDARSTRSTNSSRPNSSQSDMSTFIIASTIPGWARVYYRRGERVSLSLPEPSPDSESLQRLPSAKSGRTNTPTDRAPFNIWRPRNRPHQPQQQQPHQRISQAESVLVADDLVYEDVRIDDIRINDIRHDDDIRNDDDIIEQEAYITRPQRRAAQPMTPRLRQDRRSQARLSPWKAPSLDENLGSMLFSRQNRQIVLFCFGFIFPFAWMIAAFLPLPPSPEMEQRPPTPTPSIMVVENQLEREFGPAEDKSRRKAKWWRNLNRIMSGLGTLLVGAIIALAIFAVKMTSK